MENKSPYHEHSPLGKIILWAGNSFFVGIGVLLAYAILEGIFNKFNSLESIPMRLLFLTIVGGVANLIYYKLIKK